MRIDTFKKGFGAKVRQYREALGLSQEQLAEKINVELSTISKIENGASFPSTKTLVNLFNFFEIHPIELFDFGIKNKAELKSKNDKLEQILDKLYNCNDKQLDYIDKMIEYLNENK